MSDRRGRSAVLRAFRLRAGVSWAVAAAMLLPMARATDAAAQSSGAAPLPPSPSTSGTAPRLETDGPWDSRIRLEVYDRVRAELVDWFQPPSGSKTPDYRYDFVGNKLQLGVRFTRAPYETYGGYEVDANRELDIDLGGGRA